MNETFSLIIGVVLLALAAVFVLKGVLTARMLEQEPEEVIEETGFEGCPAEVVERIFSDRDEQFIRGFQSPALQTYFETERRAVALLWVRQTASGIRRIMRDHAAAARRSADLQFMTEARLFAQYSGLMVICGALFLSILMAGPLWVRGLAGYAQKLSVGIADTQQAFAARLNSKAAGA